jgi:hypothetical protein
LLSSAFSFLAETDPDSDVVILHQSPKKPSEAKDQRSTTPNSTSKTQTILNSYFDIKSTPTTPADKKSGLNSSSKKSAHNVPKSAKARRRLVTEDSKLSKSRLGRKKKGGTQTRTGNNSRQKKKITVCFSDDDSDVICIGDTEQIKSKRKKLDDCVEMEQKRDPVGSPNHDQVAFSLTELPSKGCTALDRPDEDVFYGATGYKESLLDRYEEDVFAGDFVHSKIADTVEDLFSDDEACKDTLLDKSDEDLFIVGVNHSKTGASADGLLDDVGNCTVFLRDESEDVFSCGQDLSKNSGEKSAEDIFSDKVDNTPDDTSVKHCLQGLNDPSQEHDNNSTVLIDKPGKNYSRNSNMYDCDDDTRNQDSASGANQLFEHNSNNSVTKVEKNEAVNGEADEDDFAPPCDGFVTPDEDETDEEFFAALDENPSSIPTSCDDQTIDSTASSESSTLQCAQQPSKSSSLLDTVSSFSSQLSPFSGYSTSSLPDSDAIDSSKKTQACSNTAEDVDSKRTPTCPHPSKQTSISSFFKPRFSVSSNGVSVSCQTRSKSKLVASTKYAKAQKPVKEDSSQSRTNTPYQSDSSGTSNNFDYIQVYGNNKKTCPFYKRIPGM